MKLIIAGTRDMSIAKDMISAALVSFNITPTEIVSGHSGVVDLIGEAWAVDHNIPVKMFPADWNQHGKAAGPIRNKQMAEYADVLLVIWDGESKGSLSMIHQMRMVDKPVHEITLQTYTPGE